MEYTQFKSYTNPTLVIVLATIDEMITHPNGYQYDNLHFSVMLFQET